MTEVLSMHSLLLRSQSTYQIYYPCLEIKGICTQFFLVANVISFWHFIFCQEEPPLELLTSMKIPSTNSIQFHGVETLTNMPSIDHTVMKTQKFQLAEIPFAIQVDDIKSLFLQASSQCIA